MGASVSIIFHIMYNIIINLKRLYKIKLKNKLYKDDKNIRNVKKYC
jgi:hypothetical protein